MGMQVEEMLAWRWTVVVVRLVKLFELLWKPLSDASGSKGLFNQVVAVNVL